MTGLDVKRREGFIVVSFQPRTLTADEQILQISDDLKKILDSTSTGTRLLLDFRNVEAIASMMLGDLVALNKSALRKGVILQFCGFTSDVLRVIETCKLNRLFDILESPPSE